MKRTKQSKPPRSSEDEKATGASKKEKARSAAPDGDVAAGTSKTIYTLRRLGGSKQDAAFKSRCVLLPFDHTVLKANQGTIGNNEQ